MSEYKDAYYSLFNMVTDAISMLKEAQQEAESVFIRQGMELLLIQHDQMAVYRHQRRTGDRIDISAALESKCCTALQRIKIALDDRSLSDPDCCERIEEIVDIFADLGIGTNRHDCG